MHDILLINNLACSAILSELHIPTNISSSTSFAIYSPSRISSTLLLSHPASVQSPSPKHSFRARLDTPRRHGLNHNTRSCFSLLVVIQALEDACRSIISFFLNQQKSALRLFLLWRLRIRLSQSTNRTKCRSSTSPSRAGQIIRLQSLLHVCLRRRPDHLSHRHRHRQHIQHFRSICKVPRIYNHRNNHGQ